MRNLRTFRDQKATFERPKSHFTTPKKPFLKSGFCAPFTIPHGNRPSPSNVMRSTLNTMLIHGTINALSITDKTGHQF
jgi:hypothetical protein